MSHFAEIDNGIVKRVIVADQTFIDSGRVGSPESWIETSYDGTVRKNYAGVGYKYDQNRDAFIAPKPYDSWVLDEDTCRYNAPIEKPKDSQEYRWDEETLIWKKDGNL